jgi:hypothetical protein
MLEPLGLLGQQLQIDAIVVVDEEDCPEIIPPLRNVMRAIRNDKAACKSTAYAECNQYTPQRKS